MKTNKILPLLSTLFLVIHGHTVETLKPSTAENIGFIFGIHLLEKFSSIKLYLAIPNASSELSKKLQNQAIAELRKIGGVIPKQFSVENLIDEKDFLTSPSLVFAIKAAQDVNGKVLPLIQATLTFEAALTVKKNNQFGQGILWGKECFVEGDIDSDLEKAFAQAFSLLIEDFKGAYLEANSTNPLKPTFYVVE